MTHDSQLHNLLPAAVVRAGTDGGHGDLCVHEEEGDDPDDGVRVLGEVGLEGGRMETECPVTFPLK